MVFLLIFTSLHMVECSGYARVGEEFTGFVAYLVLSKQETVIEYEPRDWTGAKHPILPVFLVILLQLAVHRSHDAICTSDESIQHALTGAAQVRLRSRFACTRSWV